MKSKLLLALAAIVFLSCAQPSYALFGQKRARAEAEEKARQALEEKQTTQEELYVLGIVLIIVVIVALIKINSINATPQTIQQVVNVHTPAHDIVAKSVVIDGTNVAGQSDGNPTSLLRLLGVVTALEKQKYTYKCYFDASTFSMLKKCELDHHARAYRDLLVKYPAIFVEVPGRTQADHAILDYAHHYGTPIISNDQFREFKDRYQWLEDSAKWRVPFVVHPTMVQLYRLGLHVEVPVSLKTVLNTFDELLNQSCVSSSSGSNTNV